MIFVTVGTHHQPFDRLLCALDRLDGELVVQYGAGAPPRRSLHSKALMAFDEILRWLDEADVVVTHAGVGSILCATRAGHIPLVVPRRREFHEHVDNHQVELTRALAERGSVVPVWQADELPTLVASAPARQAPSAIPEPKLCPAVREALFSSRG